MPLETYEAFPTRTVGPDALSARGLRPTAAEPELNLLGHFRLLWRGRLILVLAPIIAAVVSVAVTSRMQRVYTTSAKLWVAPPKFGEQAVAINVGNFRALLDNHGLAGEVLREFRLDSPPYNISALTFVRDNLEIVNVRDTNVLL